MTKRLTYIHNRWNWPKFWLRTQCWANSQDRPLFLSVLPFLDYLAFPTFHPLFSFSKTSIQSQTLFFTSQTHMSHPFPSRLLHSVQSQVPDTASSAELCKTVLHLSQLNLLAVHQTQSAGVGMLMQGDTRKGAITLPMSSCRQAGGKKAFWKFLNKK